MKCIAYCLAKAIPLTNYVHFLQKQNQPLSAFREAVVFECPHGRGTVIVFAYGTVVFWAVAPSLIDQMLKEIKPHCQELLDHPIEDEFSFSYGPTFSVVNDQIVLDQQDPYVMLALSHAFAQSVKLELFEGRVQQAVVQAQFLVDELSSRGKIDLTRKEIAKRIGWLMQQRYSINLHCDVLDTPDFFWDRTELERYYQAGASYLDLSQRVNVLYRRMDTVSDVFEILTTEINHRHSAFLEWIIIVLILIEVMMSFALHWLPDLMKAGA
jgi:uncharacterized Rmd1/YagE family protein